MEETYQEYIDNLLAIVREVYRVLKPTGSFWLNIGDSYKDKQLLNIPYRVAIRMQDEQKWILRNTVVWDKVKGAMSRSKDSLGCEYEPVFHFVKKKSGYYYDSDAVRKKPRSAHVENGAVVSATGVSGLPLQERGQQAMLRFSLNANQLALIWHRNILSLRRIDAQNMGA